MKNKKIFISSVARKEDEIIKQKIYNFLKNKGYTPVLNKNENKDISEIKNSNSFIVILSERALMSETITEEVQTAKEQGNINIIPVSVKLSESEVYNFDISEYLRGQRYIEWEDNKCFDLILKEVENQSIKNEEPQIAEPKYNINIPMPNAPLIPPGGTVGTTAEYYIKRKGEDSFISQILIAGALIRIKGPRQFGKTSLLSRVIQFARKNNHAVIPINFQLTDKNITKSLELLLKQICVMASRKLHLPVKMREFWDKHLDLKTNCTIYFEEYLIPQVGKPVLLAIDEADRIFENQDVSGDFFSMLRGWHENRHDTPPWEQFKLAVAHSTEAYLAIQDLNQSPFNVGLERALKEFNKEEVSLFAEKMRIKLSSSEIDGLMNIVGGHPYLVHLSLYNIATKTFNINDIIKTATSEDGLFYDHLFRHFLNISSDAEFITAMKEIVNKGTCQDNIISHKLRAAGLIKMNSGKVEPAIKLYSDYFRQKIKNKHI